MRFLTDENIARSILVGLRAAGHDVLSVTESMTGLPDCEILARAMAEARIVVTFDKDFGELAFRSQLPASCGVVLFRITHRSREQDIQRVLDTCKADRIGAARSGPSPTTVSAVVRCRRSE